MRSISLWNRHARVAGSNVFAVALQFRAFLGREPGTGIRAASGKTNAVAALRHVDGRPAKLFANQLREARRRVVLAPAGTPVDVIAKVYDSRVRTAAGAGLREQLVDIGMEPLVNTPESYGSEIAADVARWAQAVRDGRLRLE